MFKTKAKQEDINIDNIVQGSEMRDKLEAALKELPQMHGIMIIKYFKDNHVDVDFNQALGPGDISWALGQATFQLHHDKRFYQHD